MKSFKQEILESQERLNEIYKKEMERGTYEDWLKRFEIGKEKKE